MLTDGKSFLDKRFPEIFIMYSKINKFVIFLIFILILHPSVKAEVFYIIYTSNVNGVIENCGCGSDPLGGIGRVKSVIDQFKKDNKNVFAIDGGDYFNSYPYPTLNKAMYKTLELINYDCLVPGDQEFVEGKVFYSKYVSSFKEKILLSNAGSDYQERIKTKIGSNQVVLYGYLSPYIFNFIEKPDDLNLSIFVNAKPEPSGENEFHIAIIHGYLSNAEQFALENPSIDLILLAHDQRKGIWKKNQAIIIGNGKDSEYISIIKVNQGSQWNISVDQKKISEELPEDSQIVKIIDEYKSN